MSVTRHNVRQLPHVLQLAQSLGADALHTFLLVPVGCGVEIASEQMVDPHEYEQVLNWFYDQAQSCGIELKATCAPHYFRIALQRWAAERNAQQRDQAANPPQATSGHPHGKGCLAGSAVCFISNRGEVYPCGYLPVRAGDLKRQSFEEIWRHSPLFEVLRDPDNLHGKCGRCEFKKVCMGCRARAYAASGDYLDEEPYCIYQPKTRADNHH